MSGNSRFSAEVDVTPESFCKLVFVDPTERIGVESREAEQSEGEAIEGRRKADVSGDG